MDNVAVSRRNHTSRKGNKENTQPAHGPKSFIRKDKTTAAPLQLKNNETEETVAKNDPFKAKPKQVGTKSTTAEALKKGRIVQRDGKAQTAPDVKHSKASLTDEAVKHKKNVAEPPKPSAVQSSKPALGTYKGKIVQSKIGSIWKTSASVGAVDLKPSAPKTGSQNMAKCRSKSVSEVPGRGTQKPAPIRSKSVSERPAQVSKPVSVRPAQVFKPVSERPAQVSKPGTSSRRPVGFCSARPPTRTIPATLTSTSSRNTTAASTKARGTQNSKPKIPATDKKVSKPGSSTLSQYRVTMDTAEERKAKLAEWLASKGKTLKRPAMTTAAAPAPPKTKVSARPETYQSQVEPQPAARCEPKPEPSVVTLNPNSAASHCDDIQKTEPTVQGQTPIIMNTTLDLLENSDADLPVDPQDTVDDIVVNLCDALEAMETPSRCSDEIPQVKDECNDVEMDGSKPEEASEKEELKNEVPEDVGERVKDEVEECVDQKVDTEDAEEVESGDDDDCVMETTTPQRVDASVIKYSVKTTPYLQSVKKTIEGEVGTSTSRRKSNIKDLKFLTPVRRSCRIERKSSRLPSMLVDPDPCVSSLAELVKLDDDPNAYIYRKNNALLEDLPDQPRV